MQDQTKGPLSGIRVLELGNFVAAPFAARIFGDFGAEVIKIERPGVGDEIRGWRRNRGTTSMMYRTIARSKRSVTLDLRSAHGQALILDLVKNVDVIIENFRPGTLERWNIGPEQLEAANPDIAIVRISGYGQSGPYSSRAGFGGVAEAVGGLRHITGHADRQPVRAAAPIGDSFAGLYGAISALIMLLARAREGDHAKPTVADVALHEAVFMAMESLVPDLDAYGSVRERTAGNLPGVVPSGAYECADGGSVLIAGNASGVFSRLMAAVGREDLATDPELTDGHKRYLREAELDEAIIAWTSVRTPSDVVDELSAAGVPVGEIFDARRIAEDSHYLERGMIQNFKVDVDGTPEDIRFPGVVPQFDGQPAEVQWIGPDLGKDTDDVLSTVLGLDPEAIDEYRRAGII
ncbi:CaiB/BaiF CoA transferase family protein [Actinomycetes bacterium M1A6_2h]